MGEARSEGLARLRTSLREAAQQAGQASFHLVQTSLNKLLDAYCQEHKKPKTDLDTDAERDIAAFNECVSNGRQLLQARCELLQEAVDDARALVDDAGVHGVNASLEGAEMLLAHSHKLAYTSFAPLLGMELVNPLLGIYLPPFPVTLQLQHSALSQYSQKRADEVAAKQAAAAVAAASEAAATANVHAAPSAAVPAMGQLPFPIPAMPAGWKPGDPIPMPEGFGAPPMDANPAAHVPPAPGADDMPSEADLDLDGGIDDDFILNAEAIDMSDEESSEEEDEDEQPSTAAATPASASNEDTPMASEED